MKQIFLFIVLIGLGLSSCKKEDKTESVSLQGKWKVEKRQFKIYEDNRLTSDETTTPVGDYFDFRTDVDLYTFIDNKLQDFVYLYLKDENQITLGGDDGTTIFKILEFTSNRLVLQTEGGNPEYKIRFEAIYTLSR